MVLIFYRRRGGRKKEEQHIASRSCLSPTLSISLSSSFFKKGVRETRWGGRGGEGVMQAVNTGRTDGKDGWGGSRAKLVEKEEIGDEKEEEEEELREAAAAVREEQARQSIRSRTE